jgi:hypothetical protein
MISLTLARVLLRIEDLKQPLHLRAAGQHFHIDPDGFTSERFALSILTSTA